MKLTVHGVVHGIETRRRWFFFRDRLLLVSMNPDDIQKIERAVNDAHPGYGSLAPKGSAVPFERLDDPSKYPVGQRVEMTASICGASEKFFLGTPPLVLDSIRPLSA